MGTGILARLELMVGATSLYFIRYFFDNAVLIGLATQAVEARAEANHEGECHWRLDLPVCA